MKIEFLENTGDDTYNNVLRIFDFSEEDTIAFKILIKEQVFEQKSELEIHSLSFVESINCHLTIKYNEKGIGIRCSKSAEFRWELNSEKVVNVCKMLENSLNSSGYYWLNDEDTETDIAILYSQGGGW